MSLWSEEVADVVSRWVRAPAFLAQAWEDELTPIATRRAELAVELHALPRSRSWRITAQLRWLLTRW